MPTRRIGRLGHHVVMPQQRLVAVRVLLGVALVVHRQRHAVGAMPRRHPAQFPPRVLHARAETGEAFREAHRHVLPVRVRQDKVVEQVSESLARNAHAQAVHVCEIGGTEPARLMHLAEEHFLGRTVLRLPLPHPPLQGAPVPLPVLLGLLPFEPLQERLGLQRCLPLQQLLQLRPDAGQRIGPRPPRVRPATFAGQLALIPVLACRLAIHRRFHRCALQRCSFV